VVGNRFGAEYYMPCKKRVIEALAGVPHRTIADHAPAVREMWDPRQVGGSEKFRNYDVTDALDPFIDDAEPQLATEIASTKKRFQTGDVLISRLRSYLKEIAVAWTSNSLPTVGSSEFIVLRPTLVGVSAETLMVFLRCPLVQTILKWSQDGSNHPRFAEEDLLSIPVPNALLRVQMKIDSFVKESIQARRDSARLLYEAKKTVEGMIIGNADGRKL
jgi:type I restriction enzyme S subunit